MNIRKTTLAGFWSWVAFVTLASAAEDATYSHTGPLLLSGIAVIDGTGHPSMPLRDILIVDGKIERLAIAGAIDAVPQNTRRIEGRNLTVLPGLIDAHVHIANIGFAEGDSERRDIAGMDRTLRAHLYAGVTTVLDLGSEPRTDLTVQLRDEIAAGDRLGPTIVTVGDTIHSLQTPKTVFELPSEATQQEIAALLNARQDMNIDFIKLYAGITPWEARHIMTEAKKRNMRGIADFWCTNLSRTVFEVSLIDGYAHGGCRQVTLEDAAWMHDNSKFALMTLTLFETMGGQRAFEDFAHRGLLKNHLVVDVLGEETIEDYYDAFTLIREEYEEGENSLYRRQLFPNLADLLPYNLYNVKLLHEEGVLIGMGTDAAFPPGTWPGEAMHRELELHVRAGIDPVDAISIATRNNAIILRREQELGTIETGKSADLLIVRGDPGTNISDTRNVVHVIKGGKLINRAALAQSR